MWHGTSNFYSNDICLPWRPYLLVIQTARYWGSCIQNKTYGRQLVQTTTVSTPHNPSWTCPPPSVLALHAWMPYLESSLVNKRLKCRRSQGSQVWSWEVYGVESISIVFILGMRHSGRAEKAQWEWDSGTVMCEVKNPNSTGTLDQMRQETYSVGRNEAYLEHRPNLTNRPN